MSTGHLMLDRDAEYRLAAEERHADQIANAQNERAEQQWEDALPICADCNTPITDDEDSAFDSHGNPVHDVCTGWQDRECPWCSQPLGTTPREPVRHEGDLVHWDCWMQIEDAETLKERVLGYLGEMREAVADNPLWRESRLGKDMVALVETASTLARAMTGDVLMQPLVGREVALLRLARGESDKRVKEALEMGR